MDDLETSQVEAEVDTTEPQVEEEVEVKEDKRPSSVVKLLKQRNELKRKAEELEAKLSDTDKLSKKVNELEEMIARQALEQEAKAEKIEFFSKNPAAKEFESEIDKLSTDKGLSYDEAFKLYAANNKPELLVDQQYRNKSNSANLTGVTPDQTKNKDNPQTMSDFDTPEEFWERSEKMARNSRTESGYTN